MNNKNYKKRNTLQQELEIRRRAVAKDIIENHSTCRELEVKYKEIYNISRQTISNDVEALKTIDISLYKKCKEVFNQNYNERGKRGAEQRIKNIKEKIS